MKFGIMDKLGGLSLEFPSRVIQLEKKKIGITEKLLGEVSDIVI